MSKSKWKGAIATKNLYKNLLTFRDFEKKNLRKKIIINESRLTLPTFFINKHIHLYNGHKLQKTFIPNFKTGYNVKMFIVTKKLKNQKFSKKKNGSKI